MNINIYNPYVRSELELMHHGIAGQKWGKKNGPPYPLGASDHSASEKKAGWRKSLGGAAKAVGRGVKKAAPVIAKAAKTTAHLANRGLLAIDKKPKFLMTDKEINERVERLKLNKTYKRALKGKFTDVVEDEKRQKQGESFGKQLLSAVGKDVVIPFATGVLNYQIAKGLADENTGEVNRLSTIMGNRAQSYGKNRSGEGKKSKGDKQNQPKPQKTNLESNPPEQETRIESPKTEETKTDYPKPSSNAGSLSSRINSLNERINNTPERVSSQTRHNEYKNIWATTQPFKKNSKTRSTLSTKISSFDAQIKKENWHTASYLIKKHGKKNTYLSYIDMLSNVKDINHSFIDERYARYMKFKI